MRDTLLLPLVLGLLAFPCASQNLRRLSHDESANEHHVHLHELNLNDVELFQKIAMTSSSDKVRGIENRTNRGTNVGEGHRYSVMYGTFLLPYVRRFHHMQRPVKFLEIGLGCDMDYGPGASVQIWNKIFNKKDIMWEAEYVEECVNKSKEKGLLDGMNVVVGDQANIPTLRKWIQETGGDFDIIIDDGGHTQDQIFNSFMTLWPTVKPGGLYFIEDLQVARTTSYGDKENEGKVMIDFLYYWMEYAVTGLMLPGASKLVQSVPIPKGIRFIMCQFEACVISKCEDSLSNYCT